MENFLVDENCLKFEKNLIKVYLLLNFIVDVILIMKIVFFYIILL